jgi:hypothetical protein
MLRIGSRSYRGRVREVTFEHVVLEVRVDLELGESSAEISWDRDRSLSLELDEVEHLTWMEFKVPLDQFDLGVSRPDSRMLAQPHDFLRAELRRSVRVPAEFPITLSASDGVRMLEGHTQDISHGGIRVAVPDGLLVGEVWQASLHLPNQPFHLLTRVVRRVGECTYALRFLGDAANGQRVVKAVFEAMRLSRGQGRPRQQGFRRT